MESVDDHRTIANWLLEPATRTYTVAVFLEQLAVKLCAAGVPLERAATSLRTRHPEVWVRNASWARGQSVQVNDRSHAMMSSPTYLDSPVAVVHESGRGFRRRLDSDIDPNFPLLRELRAAGHTDYLIEALPLADGVYSFIAWSTRANGGFGTAIDTLCALTPAIATVIESQSQRLALGSLMRAYLGASAAQRVMAGDVVRGAGQELRCAIMFCDLRGYTQLSENRAPRDVLSVLERYFDIVGSAIAHGQGDVIKFVGDAILAIFPEQSAGLSDACVRAVRCALQALVALREENRGRQRPIEVGFGIHAGAVFFGNVGTGDRLDFTVIGAPVNEAARLESMCRPLQVSLVLSDTVAEHVRHITTLESLGEHVLKGVHGARMLWTARPTEG